MKPCVWSWRIRRWLRRHNKVSHSKMKNTWKVQLKFLDVGQGNFVCYLKPLNSLLSLPTLNKSMSTALNGFLFSVILKSYLHISIRFWWPKNAQRIFELSQKIIQLSTSPRQTWFWFFSTTHHPIFCTLM